LGCLRVPQREAEMIEPLRFLLSYLGRDALVAMRTMAEASWDMAFCCVFCPHNYKLPMWYARTVQVIDNAIAMHDAWLSNWRPAPKEN
jgi:hypothetical protein